MNSYNVIGLMSGTSMDGVDLAYCRFELIDGNWSYKIRKAVTYEYPADWRKRLNDLFHASAVDYARTHAAYGKYLGGMVQRFRKEFDVEDVDFVSSHGHTIFHQPATGFTSQIGEGAALAATCGSQVVCDFRTGDVAYGGQGAPLVPVGDQLLFGNYTYCLNLGGIANISYTRGNKRIAFDVCPCNILLNLVASQAGALFDKGGMLAAAGKIDKKLLDELNAVSFYSKSHPKSLGKEEMEEVFIPMLARYPLAPADLLRTLVEHMAFQIAAVTAGSANEFSTLLLSGGGAMNTFLVDQLRKAVVPKLEIPDPAIINYKEALIFAFLGVLRMRGEPNSLQSVTGATKDVIGGSVYLS